MSTPHLWAGVKMGGQDSSALYLNSSSLLSSPELYELGEKSRRQASLSLSHSLTVLAAGCWLSPWRDIYLYFLLCWLPSL